MSKIADDLYFTLKNLFPYDCIEKEHYINYKGTRLFFDFYIKSLGLLFEVQGEQHFKFNKHMHGTIDNFRAQKFRDNLKKIFVEENSMLTLVYFYDKVDKITEALVVDRIYEAQTE